MASKQRGLEAKIPDLENIVHKSVMGKTDLVKTHGTTRSALGELGNRLHLHGAQDNAKKTNTAMGPPQAVKARHPEKGILKANSEAVKRQETIGKSKLPSSKSVSVKEKVDTIYIEKASSKGNTEPVRKQEGIAKTAPVENKMREPISFSSKQLTFIDPDASSKDDPQMVAEYVEDIFKYLRELETRYPIREKFLASHTTTPRMRTVLLNWLVEVHSNFKMCLETLHMCCALVDRYLQDTTDVGRETLQLVGTSALLIASKYEEMYIPDIGDFVYICDDTFTSKQIIDTEKDILKKLNFNLGRPLSIHFLRRYSKIARVEPEEHTLAKYILELALIEYELCHIKPSIQAAAAICLSMAVMKEVSDPSKLWTPTLVHYTTYKYSDFKSVMISFAHVISKAEVAKCQAIRKKYSVAAYGKISLNSKLRGSLIRRLASVSPTLRTG